MRIEHHPYLDVLVREDGCIYLPQSGSNPAHWTFGCKRDDGYLLVGIGGKLYRVHRLVAETFIPNPENKKEIDHINRNPQDNSVANLRWCSRSENLRNTSKNDRVDARGGTHSYEDVGKYYREKAIRYKQSKRRVLFSDGSYRWIPHEEALELLKIPLKQRIFAK